MATRQARPISNVWKFFTVDTSDPRQAVFNLCKSVLKRGGKTAKEFGTGNLLKH